MNFVEVLRDHARGTVADDAQAELLDLIQAVSATGKEGSVTVKLKAKPSGNRTVMLGFEVTSKVPQADPEVGVFFVDRNGVLTKDDPTQPKLPMAEVDPGGPAQVAVVTGNQPGEVVQVDPATGEIIANTPDPAAVADVAPDQTPEA